FCDQKFALPSAQMCKARVSFLYSIYHLIGSPCCPTGSVIKRGAWTAQEDFILVKYISIHGEGQWRALPKNAGLKRCGKSCRLRWLNYLRPNIKRGNISPDEEELIIRMHKLLGNRWSLIAGRLPGRTDNEVKNYWNTHLSKNRVPDKKTLPQPHTPNAKNLRKYEDCGNSDHQELRSSDVVETVKASKSWCDYFNTHNNAISDFADPSITENIFESMENVHEDSPCSMLNLDDGSFLDSQHSAEKEMCTSDVVKDNLSSWECDMLLSGSHDLRFKESFAKPSDELDPIGFSEIRADDGRGMAEIYSDTQQQQVDWINELECLQKSNMQSLTMLLLESEEDWDERSRKTSSKKFNVVIN
ncbi:hypothetical protein KI387_030756, partial [Taxus chinensis]